jgi:hypothetical protein
MKSYRTDKMKMKVKDPIYQIATEKNGVYVHQNIGHPPITIQNYKKTSRIKKAKPSS